MLHTVNACVALHRTGRWLLIVRSPDAAHAPGTLSLVGGHFEITEPAYDVLEDTARREAAEEVGVELFDIPLTYAESSFFIGDTGNRVLSVVFAAELPADVTPTAAEKLHRLQRRSCLDPAASRIVGQVLDELLSRLLLARADRLATEDPEVLAGVTKRFAED